MLLAQVSLVAPVLLFGGAAASGYMACRCTGGQRSNGRIGSVPPTPAGLWRWIVMVQLRCFLPGALGIILVAVLFALSPPPLAVHPVYPADLLRDFRDYLVAVAHLAVCWGGALTAWGAALGWRCRSSERAGLVVLGAAAVILGLVLTYVRTFGAGPEGQVRFDLDLPVFVLSEVGFNALAAGVVTSIAWAKRGG